MASKYQSTLTGEQIDAALLDMAQHNSEAYAIGKRDGTDVGSSDPTYHNNAKYYAEHADEAAKEQAENAEAWALGTRNGIDVPSTDPAHNNNAKFYSQTAQGSASNAATSAASAANKAQEASGYVSQAQGKVNEAQAFANAAESAATEAQSIVEGNVLCYDYDADVQYIMAFSVRGGFPVVTFTEA